MDKISHMIHEFTSFINSMNGAGNIKYIQIAGIATGGRPGKRKGRS